MPSIITDATKAAFTGTDPGCRRFWIPSSLRSG
jgi:hypothetical protein